MSSKHHQKVYGCLAVSALHSAKELLESHSLYSALAQSDFLKSDNNKWVILWLAMKSVTTDTFPWTAWHSLAQPTEGKMLPKSLSRWSSTTRGRSCWTSLERARARTMGPSRRLWCLWRRKRLQIFLLLRCASPRWMPHRFTAIGNSESEKRH